MNLTGASAHGGRAHVPRLELYRLLADADRLRILALCSEEQLSVGELSALLEESQPQVSRKVGPLRQAGLLEGQRDGTRLWLRVRPGLDRDPVVTDALEVGRTLCLKDGSLARLPAVVAAREERAREIFAASGAEPSAQTGAVASTHFAHLMGLSPLLPGRALAIDVGTGEGPLLDVLAPLYARVIAVDRSPARLARCAARVAERGFHHVSLFQGAYDDMALVERVDRAGGADLVYASRALHHASRPAQAMSSLARLLRRGGHLVVLDYLPHDHEQMRETQGDVWLGFAASELARMAAASGLEYVADAPVPPAFHRDGPDAHLDWHVFVARRSSPSTAVNNDAITPLKESPHE